MKTFHRLTVIMSMLFLLSAIPAIAQIDSSVAFDAPFPFYAGNAKMPAGHYTLTQPNDSAQLLMIESENGSNSAFIEFAPIDLKAPVSRSEITFNNYGNADFLGFISLQGRSSGMQILASRTEKEAAKAGAATKHSLVAFAGH